MIASRLSVVLLLTAFYTSMPVSAEPGNIDHQVDALVACLEVGEDDIETYVMGVPDCVSGFEPCHDNSSTGACVQDGACNYINEQQPGLVPPRPEDPDPQGEYYGCLNPFNMTCTGNNGLPGLEISGGGIGNLTLGGDDGEVWVPDPINGGNFTFPVDLPGIGGGSGDCYPADATCPGLAAEGDPNPENGFIITGIGAAGECHTYTHCSNSFLFGIPALVGSIDDTEVCPEKTDCPDPDPGNPPYAGTGIDRVSPIEEHTFCIMAGANNACPLPPPGTLDLPPEFTAKVYRPSGTTSYDLCNEKCPDHVPPTVPPVDYTGATKVFRVNGISFAKIHTCAMVGPCPLPGQVQVHYLNPILGTHEHSPCFNICNGPGTFPVLDIGAGAGPAAACIHTDPCGNVPLPFGLPSGLEVTVTVTPGPVGPIFAKACLMQCDDPAEIGEVEPACVMPCPGWPPFPPPVGPVPPPLPINEVPDPLNPGSCDTPFCGDPNDWLANPTDPTLVWGPAWPVGVCFNPNTLLPIAPETTCADGLLSDPGTIGISYGGSTIICV